jgi:transcriptional antiterminator Rof (Rho-off)
MVNTIQCGLYDYFEIACMRRSKISLELHNGDRFEGVASNLQSKDGKEFLTLMDDDLSDDSAREINLMDIDILVFVKSGERISIS